jgi:hypothetical protein
MYERSSTSSSGAAPTKRAASGGRSGLLDKIAARFARQREAA